MCVIRLRVEVFFVTEYPVGSLEETEGRVRSRIDPLPPSPRLLGSVLESCRNDSKRRPSSVETLKGTIDKPVSDFDLTW